MKNESNILESYLISQNELESKLSLLQNKEDRLSNLSQEAKANLDDVRKNKNKRVKWFPYTLQSTLCPDNTNDKEEKLFFNSLPLLRHLIQLTNNRIYTHFDIFYLILCHNETIRDLLHIYRQTPENHPQIP